MALSCLPSKNNNEGKVDGIIVLYRLYSFYRWISMMQESTTAWCALISVTMSDVRSSTGTICLWWSHSDTHTLLSVIWSCQASLQRLTDLSTLLLAHLNYALETVIGNNEQIEQVLLILILAHLFSYPSIQLVITCFYRYYCKSTMVLEVCWELRFILIQYSMLYFIIWVINMGYSNILNSLTSRH